MNKISNTQQRLKEIMEERGLKQVDIMKKAEKYKAELNIKMPKNYLSQYVNGKSTPDNLRLVLLSKVLGVSEAWLMGYDVPRSDSESDEKEYPLIDETIDTMKKLEEPRQKVVLNTASTQLEEQNQESPKIIQFNDVMEEIEYETLYVHGLESAGDGEWQENDLDIEVQIPKSEIPAVFDDLAMVVGDSMRPKLHNADILFIKFTKQIEIGEIGVFRTSRGNFVKKLRNGYLESLNPDYDDIYFSEDEECEAIGVVIDYYRK